MLTTTTVRIGYTAPWRQVEAMLLLAAERTPGIRLDPKPHVFQTALEDAAVQYTMTFCLEGSAPCGSSRRTCCTRTSRISSTMVRRADHDAGLRRRSRATEARAEEGLVRGAGAATRSLNVPPAGHDIAVALASWPRNQSWPCPPQHPFRIAPPAYRACRHARKTRSRERPPSSR